MVKRHLVGFGLALGACARYEYVTPDCSTEAVPSAPSRIEWRYVGVAGQLTGQIVNASTRQPVRDAQVRLSGLDWFEFPPSDSLGGVRMRTRRTGGDTIFVRVISHRAAMTPLEIRSDTGIAFLALMSPIPAAATDGCGYVLVPRRKPWWKLW